MPADEMRALSDDQIQQFIRDGFVRIDRSRPLPPDARPTPAETGKKQDNDTGRSL